MVRRLELAEIDYYVTGSEALAALGVAYRETNDIDLVLLIRPADYETRVRPAFEPDYLVDDLIRNPPYRLGSTIHVQSVGKVDFIIRDPSAGGAMSWHGAFGSMIRASGEPG